MTDMVLNFGTPVPKADPGTYPAKLVGVDPFVIDEGTPDAKTLIRWDFTLTGTDDPETPGYEIIVDGVSSTATGPRAKMRQWVTALNGGVELNSAVNLTTLRTTLVGRECLVAVVVKDGYSKVDGVLAAPRRPAAPVTASKPDIEAVDAAIEVADSLPF